MKVMNEWKEFAAAGPAPFAALLIGLLALLWSPLQRMVQFQDVTAGFLDPTIWLLILLSIGVFLVLLTLVWYLANYYWLAFGLPERNWMVLQFNRLDAWQQLKFYYGVFALLLLAGIGCLTAVL